MYYSNWNHAGTYSIGVNITDSYGSVGESSTQVPVPPFTVYISGNNPAQAGCPTVWVASAQYAAAPYTYSWTINGSPCDSGQGDTVTYTPSEGSFTLGVGVTDANGVYTSTAQIITVTSGNCA